MVRLELVIPWSLMTYPHPHKLNGTESEPQNCDTSKDTNESNGIAVKLEPNWFWKQYGANECAFRRVETWKKRLSDAKTLEINPTRPSNKA